MKAIIIIILGFLIFPLAYLSFLNLNDSSFFAKDNFSSANSEHDQVVIVDTSRFFFTQNSQTNTYEMALKDGSKVTFSTDKGNLKDLFKAWKTTPQGTNILGLEPPTDCRYLNIVVGVKTSIQDIANNLERMYCSTKLEPNFSYIP